MGCAHSSDAVEGAQRHALRHRAEPPVERHPSSPGDSRDASIVFPPADGGTADFANIAVPDIDPRELASDVAFPEASIGRVSAPVRRPGLTEDAIAHMPGSTGSTMSRGTHSNATATTVAMPSCHPSSGGSIAQGLRGSSPGLLAGADDAVGRAAMGMQAPVHNEPSHNPLAAPPAAPAAGQLPPRMPKPQMPQKEAEAAELARASVDARMNSEDVVSRFMSNASGMSMSSRRDSDRLQPDRFSIDSRSLSVLCTRRVATTSARVATSDLRIPGPPGSSGDDHFAAAPPAKEQSRASPMERSANGAEDLRSPPAHPELPATSAGPPTRKKFLRGSGAFGAGASGSASNTASSAEGPARNPLKGHHRTPESPDDDGPPPDAIPIEELVYYAPPDVVARWVEAAARLPAAKLAATRRHREIQGWLDGVGFAPADAPANSLSFSLQAQSAPGMMTRLTARNIDSHQRILNRINHSNRSALAVNTGAAGNGSNPRAGSNASSFESPRTNSTASATQQQRKNSKPASVSRQLAATLWRDSMSNSQLAPDLSDTLGDDDYADGDDGDGGLLADVHELADDASSGAGAVEGAPSRGTLCSERDGVRSVISSSAVSPSPFGSPWVPASPGLQSQSRRSALNRW
mmetsp:Transcript_13773/g.42866  ORF Transcript_13773/g.42866 Transcript_13773/m.42866 type:complete len:635 (-) Transcript_13773:417-2321(-)